MPEISLCLGTSLLCNDSEVNAGDAVACSSNALFILSIDSLSFISLRDLRSSANDLIGILFALPNGSDEEADSLVA